MKILILTWFLIVLGGCRSNAGSVPDDNRFVVLGPSLVEIMVASGLEEMIIGIDRYSSLPSGDAELVGGYIDPSLEAIVSLKPTSIHMIGESALLRDLAEELNIPCYSYGFDNLEDIYESLDSLHIRYGRGALEYRCSIERNLDSLFVLAAESEPVTAMIVIYHERGSSSMTIAGRNTFFADLLRGVGGRISAPEAGAWPMVSAEGVLEMDPDRIICLFPGMEDSIEISRSEMLFWASLGFDETMIHCLFESYLMIPGSRLVEISQRLSSCLR